MVGAPTPIVNVVHCSGNERPCLVSFEGRPVRFPFGGPIIASESFVPRNYYFTWSATLGFLVKTTPSSRSKVGSQIAWSFLFAFRLALGIVQKSISLELGKTPIYRVWDRFQLGSCLVFLAFLYYAFHRELLNRLLLLAKRNLEGELPALELIEWFLFTAKLIVLSYLTLCWYLTLGLGAGLSHALTWLPRPDTQLRRERAYPSGQLLILALENLVKAEPAP